MNLSRVDNFESQARAKIIVWVVAASILVLLPFSVNNLIEHAYMLGYGSLLIVALLAFNGWFSLKGCYYPLMTLAVLTPAIMLLLFYAFQQQGIIGALWCYPAIISFYFMLPERQAWLANALLMLMAVPSAIHFLDPHLTARVIATLVCVSVFAVIFVRIISKQQQQLKQLAMTDSLTGLSNRVMLHTCLEQATDSSERRSYPSCLIALDLDHFKKINDELGHGAGDRVLKGIGHLLSSHIRRSDQVFRLGGEEFLIVLHESDLQQAVTVAEILRNKVETSRFLPDRVITVSGGVAVHQPGEHWRDWLKRSDDLLYQAKQSGRNRILS